MPNVYVVRWFVSRCAQAHCVVSRYPPEKASHPVYYALNTQEMFKVPRGRTEKVVSIFSEHAKDVFKVPRVRTEKVVSTFSERALAGQ